MSRTSLRVSCVLLFGLALSASARATTYAPPTGPGPRPTATPTPQPVGGVDTSLPPSIPVPPSTPGGVGPDPILTATGTVNVGACPVVGMCSASRVPCTTDANCTHPQEDEVACVQPNGAGIGTCQGTGRPCYSTYGLCQALPDRCLFPQPVPQNME